MATTTVTNQNYTPASTAGPTLPKQPTGGPLVVSTSKAADDHIAGLGNNITTQLNGMNQQAANKQQTVSQFANDALTQQANRSGMTPQQMGAQAEQQMKDRVIQQSQANPGQLQTGAQMGSLQTGTEQTPITFQAMTQNNPQAQPTGATQSPTSTQQPGSTTSATPTSTQSPSSTSGISASRQNAVQGLLDQGITDPNQMLNYLNFDEKGNKIGDFTADEVNNLLGSAKQTPEGQLAALNRQSDQAFNDYSSKIQSIQNGTFPLNPTQQATISSIMANFQQLKQSQMAANRNYVGAIRQAGITSGRQRYAPEIEAGNILQAVNVGVQKLAKIEAEASQALIQAQSAFQKEDYEQATKAYELFEQHNNKKTEQLQKMMDLSQRASQAAANQEIEMMKFKAQQEQQSLMNQLAFAQFDQQKSQQAFNQIMASSQFSYQQKQDAVKNAIESDKFTWQQKQDMIKNALEQGKFDYQQEKDMKQYLLDVKKLESADTPNSYKEWKLSGSPGSYATWLKTEKVSSKPPTADQSTTGVLVNNMKQGNDTVDLMTNSYAKNLSTLEFLKQEKLPDAAKSQDFRRFEQGARAFVEGWLRRTSGAAISDGEWASAFKQFLPQAGDGPEVLAQKKRARQTVMNGMADAAGPAVSDSLKKQIQSGKTTYYTLDDYITGNPGDVQKIDQIGKDHPNWSDDDILQILQAQPEAGFNDVPSTTQNGSTSSAEPGLGGLSAKYESSGDPGAIGYDSTGGFSYGSYQLAHNNAKKFVDQSPFAADFKGIPFNSEAFKQKWKEIAKRDPEGFKQAQQDYIAQTHYEPQKERLASIGVDLDNFSPAFKDVVFSTAVQHGANNNIIEQAVKKLGKNASEEDLIKAVYKERWAGGKRFASSTPAVRNSVYKRFFGKGGELNTALKQLKQYA